MFRYYFTILAFVLFSNIVFAETILFNNREYDGYSSEDKQVLERYMATPKMNKFTPDEQTIIRKFVREVVKRDYVFGGGEMIPDKDIPISVPGFIASTYSRSSYSRIYTGRGAHTVITSTPYTVVTPGMVTNPLFSRLQYFNKMSESSVNNYYKLLNKPFSISVSVGAPLKMSIYNNYYWSEVDDLDIAFLSRIGVNYRKENFMFDLMALLGSPGAYESSLFGNKLNAGAGLAFGYLNDTKTMAYKFGSDIMFYPYTELVFYTGIEFFPILSVGTFFNVGSSINFDEEVVTTYFEFGVRFLV